MKVMVLAAGLGTRIRHCIGDLPKVMAPIKGRPLLEITLELLRYHGISEVHLNLHYQPETIITHFGDGSRFGMRLVYHLEDRLWGTAGSAARMATAFDQPFLIMYGDVLTNLNITGLAAAHKVTSPAVTMALYHAPNPADCGLVELDDHGWVAKFQEKPPPETVKASSLANAGIYVVDPAILQLVPSDTPYDFGRDLFPRLMREKRGIRGYTVPPGTYLLDIGTPANYEKAQSTWKDHEGGPGGNPEPSPGLFLDRDGVINSNRNDYVKSWEEFEFQPGVLEDLAALARLGLPVFVVTNQSCIGRGMVSYRDIEDLHERMAAVIRAHGGQIDDIAVCIHTPEQGCNCRKPRPGLLVQLAERHHLDLSRSYLIGDSSSDAGAALAAGATPVLLEPGTGRKGFDPRAISTLPEAVETVPNLRKAVAFIARRLGKAFLL